MLIFTVPGEPVAKGRARATTVNGSARMYTPAKTVNYEGLVAVYAARAMAGRPLLIGPLEMSFEARFSIPKSWNKARRAAQEVNSEYVIKRPDLDNIEKALADGMNGVVYKDDSRIVQTAQCRKVYSALPGVTVWVRQL